MSRLESIDAFLAYCVDVCPSMNLVSLRTLIAISRADFTKGEFDNLPSVQELADTTGVQQSTMSRVLQNLGDGDGHRSGLGLVESFKDPAEYRVKRTALTSLGQHLLHGAIFAAADIKQKREMLHGQIDPGKGGLSPLWVKEATDAAAGTGVPFALYVGASSGLARHGTAGGFGIGIVLAGDAIKVDSRVMNASNHSGALLSAIVFALETAPRIKNAEYRIVGAEAWMTQLANEPSQNNPKWETELWRRLVAAAKPLGDLRCAGGRVRFERAMNEDDRHFHKIAKLAAQNAKARRK